VCVRVCVLFDELPDGFLKGRFVKEEPQRLFRSFCLNTAFWNNPWAIFKALMNVLYDMMWVTEHLCIFFGHADILMLSNNKIPFFLAHSPAYFVGFYLLYSSFLRKSEELKEKVNIIVSFMLCTSSVTSRRIGEYGWNSIYS